MNTASFPAAGPLEDAELCGAGCLDPVSYTLT